MKCRESLVLFAFLLVFSFTAFGRRASLNTFAVNKVYTSASNTVVCVPWSGYATNEPPPLAINKLVNSLNLNVDDMLLACTNESTKYDAWQYVKDDKGQPFWKQVNVVERYNPGGLDSFGVTNGLRRGTGLWVVRKSHVAADAIPLYLHGQYATNEASVVVASGTTNNPSAVLLADMDYTKRMNVNDMVDWCRVESKTGKFVESKTGMAEVYFLRALARALSSPASATGVPVIRNPLRQMPSRGTPRQSAPPTALDPLRGQRWLRHGHARRFVAVSGTS